MQKEWVWMIAGGIMQVPMIDEIKRRDYSVIVSDRNTEAPGCKIADQVIELDVYDVEGHVSAAESMSEKPVAVLTVGSDSGVTVSAVAQVLGVPSASIDVAVKCKSKVETRQALDAKHPVWLEINRDEPSPNFLWKRRCKTFDINPYPCVLKPIDQSGSRGITLIDNPWKWGKAIEKARKVTRSQSFIVEEYLYSSIEIATDFLVYNNKVHFLNAARRIFYRIFGVEAGHVNPYKLPAAAMGVAKRTIAKLGVDEGPIKIDMIKDKRYGWVVVEAATRLSGGFDHMYTSPLATGKDITGIMLDYALDKKFDRSKLSTKKDSGYACAFSPIYRPGKIERWKKPPRMKGLKHTFILENDNISMVQNCATRPAFVIAKGDTELDALKNAIRASRRLIPIYA